MSEHIDRKHSINEIADIETRRILISRCALDDTDRALLELMYLRHKPLDYIADTLGLSYSAASKRHLKAVKTLGAIVLSAKNRQLTNK